MRTHRPTIAILVASLLLAGCVGTAGQEGGSSAPPNGPANAPTGPASGGGATPEPSAGAGDSRPPDAPDAWLAVGSAGQPGISVVLASTGELMLLLPDGVPSNPQWGRIVTTTTSGGRTKVGDLTVQPGLGGSERTIDGDWRLPTIGYDPTPVGLSGDGSTVALVQAGAPVVGSGSGVSRLAVVNLVRAADPPRFIELQGSFEYDALSPDGSTLYLVEHLTANPGGRYQVRAVDVATGRLKDGVIADKRNIGEAMAGWPISQLRRDDGMVFTLYRGAEHPFVHALNTVDGWAVCIDLPATGAADAAATLDWGLAASPDGGSVYAANATLGLVVEIDAGQLTVRRSASVEPLTAAAGGEVVPAKFGHQAGGPVGRRVVVSPDGTTVYAAGAGGIVAIASSSLAESGRLLVGQAVDALGVPPDQGTIFALLHDGGRIVELDARSGTVVRTVPGDGFDRLLAVVPW